MARTGPGTARSRDLRAIVRDGVYFNVMVGVGETYVPAFVLAAGLGQLAAGFVATLPMLAGALFQLATPAAARRLGSYRRWVVACARLQALCFVPWILGALLERVHVAWVFAAAAAYWGFGMATGPAWNAWVTALVPPRERPRFFAHRTRLAQAALLAGILAGGILLQQASERGRLMTTFAGLFALAAAARWISSAYLARQSEPEGLARSHRVLPLREILGGLGGSDAGRLLFYLLAMQLSVQVAAPFFTPYMLGHLELSYWSFTLLTASAFVARIVTLPFVGRLAHLHGVRRVFRLGAIGIVPLPALWLVSDQLGYLVALQVLSGLVWGALELATLLSFFDALDERDRASILTLFNLANTVAMAVGVCVGGLILVGLDGSGTAYAVLFLVSVGARLASLLLLPRLRVSLVAPEGVALRTLAVRPALGAIQRPILPTLPQPAGTAEDEASLPSRRVDRGS